MLCLDPLGAVGDGGAALFEAEMFARLPAENRQRAKELDERGLAGGGTDADALEGMRLVWPAYFADWDAAPPMPPFSLSIPAYAGGFESLTERLPRSRRRCRRITVPLGIVAGARSPMPVEEAARRECGARSPARGSRSSRAAGTSRGSSGPDACGRRWSGWPRG